MTDIVITQFNSTMFYLRESKKRVLSEKTPPAQITGKKIVTESQVPLTVNKNHPPVQIFSKKQPQEKEVPKLKTEKTSLQSGSKKKPIKETSPKPQLIKKLFPKLRLKQLLNPARPKNKTPKSSRNSEKDWNKKNASLNIEALLKKASKREKHKKTEVKKEKKGQEELKKIKKLELQKQNKQIREENAKCKKNKFRPKYCWGVDQTRLKDARRIRKIHKVSRSKGPKSSERVKIELGTIKEIQNELKAFHVHSKSFGHKVEMNQMELSNKGQWNHNPEVLAYMKKQDLTRREKKNAGKFIKLVEDYMIHNSLKLLKSIVKDSKLKKNELKVERKTEKSNKKEEKKFEKEISLESKTSEKYLNKSKELSKPHNTSQKYSENKEIYRFNKKVSENSAAIKIQSHIRRFLVQKRQRSEKNSSFSDSIVKTFSTQPATKNPSIILQSKSNKPLNIELSSSEGSPMPEKSQIDQSLLAKTEKKKKEYHEKLKDQLIWRQAQIENIKYLKENEKHDMQLIAEKWGKTEEIGGLLNEIIEKRYDQLLSLLEQNLKNDEDSLIHEMTTPERQDFNKNLEIKRKEYTKQIQNNSKSIKNYIENILSKNLSNDPNYLLKPKTHLSIISYEVGLIQSSFDKNVQNNSVYSPLPKDSIQESTINQVFTDEDLQSSNFFVGEMQVSSDSENDKS